MKNQKATLTVKTIASCALLAAISIVMARLLSFATPDGVRWSADKFPLFLAGMLFGPLMGAMTGFVADLLGSIMQFGFNPFLCPPAILYGLFGGLFRWYLAKKFSVVRVGIAYLFPVVLGSILYQSFALAYFYFSGGTYMEGILYYLGFGSLYSIGSIRDAYIAICNQQYSKSSPFRGRAFEIVTPPLMPKGRRYKER